MPSRFSTRFTLAAIFCAATVHAQSNTGVVSGTATDPQGKPIAGGAVTLRGTDQSSVRTVTTDAHGHFGVAGLVPGAYTVEATFKGLALRRPVRLTVAVGTSTQVDIKLEVARARAHTTVTARGRTSEGNTTTPPINETNPEIGTMLAGTVVTYLPNRDRNVSQFDQLAENSHEDQEGTGISIAGQRSTALATVVDGVSFSSPLFGGLRGVNDTGFLLPQTVVREFEIVSSGVGAEVGQTNAGLINVATKEGTNRLRGEAMYTGRPATLSSADAFGNSLDNFQSFFGASEGGALRKDRSFFYAGFEQEFLHLPTYFQLAPQAPGSVIPASLTSQQSQINQRSTPLALSGRLDQTLSAHNTLSLDVAGNRIRIANFNADNSSRTLAAPSVASSFSGQSFFTRASLTTVLTPRTVNQALFSWSSDHRGQTPNSPAPTLFINGLGTFGGDPLGPHLYTSQDYQLLDSVSIIRGKRLFTLGGNFDFAPAYEQREANLNGRFDYDSLAAFQANLPRRFQQTFLTGTTHTSVNTRALALYVTAKVELREKLTLTAGLRWAGQWNPQPTIVNARISQTQSMPNDLLQFQPRVGLAWGATRKTVVRVSSGLYSAPTPATIFHRVFADNGTQTTTADSYFDPALLIASAAFTAAPHALALAPAGLTTPNALVFGIDPRFRNPQSLQAALSVDQAISPKLTLRGGYLHDSTWHLERRLDENLFAPTFNPAGLPVFPATRPLAGVGRLLTEQSSAHSSYDAFSLSGIAQLSQRSQLTVNYTLARTRDDDTTLGPYSIDSALDPFDLQLERGYSALDQRNTLNVAAIFNLPLGLKLNPIFVAHSGLPYSALIGFDTQNDANDFNDRALRNGVESPRNQFRQPSFNDTDLRIVKDFTLKGQGHHLDLFMDVFNITGSSNRNFGPEQVSLYGNAQFPVYSAAQPLFAPNSGLVGGPRELQFTARLVGF